MAAAGHDGAERTGDERVATGVQGGPMRLLEELSAELEGLVARAAPAVVGVEHRRGQGSGVVLAGDGFVVTNAHVVAGAGGPRRLRLRLASNGDAGAEVVGADPRTDLAVLRAEAEDLPSLALAGAREQAA